MQGYRSTPSKMFRHGTMWFWRCDWCRIAFWGKDSYKEYLNHHGDCKEYVRDTHESKFSDYGFDSEGYPVLKKKKRWRQIVKLNVVRWNWLITDHPSF